jgi:hypothetical protein
MSADGFLEVAENHQSPPAQLMADQAGQHAEGNVGIIAFSRGRFGFGLRSVSFTARTGSLSNCLSPNDLTANVKMRIV